MDLDDDVSLDSVSSASVACSAGVAVNFVASFIAGWTDTFPFLLITIMGDSKGTPPLCSSQSLIAGRIHAGHAVVSKFAIAVLPGVGVTSKAITCPSQFSNGFNRERSRISVGTESEPFTVKSCGFEWSIASSLPCPVHVKWPLESGDIAPLPSGRTITTDGLVSAGTNGYMGLLNSVEDPQLCHGAGLRVFARDSIEPGDDCHNRIAVDLGRPFVDDHSSHSTVM